MKLYEILAMDWKAVAERIGLDVYKIDIISNNHHGNQLECIREVTKAWNTDAPKFKNYSYTWNGLCKLLRDRGLSAESTKLEEALSADVSSFKTNLPPTSEGEWLIVPLERITNKNISTMYTT